MSGIATSEEANDDSAELTTAKGYPAVKCLTSSGSFMRRSNCFALFAIVFACWRERERERRASGGRSSSLSAFDAGRLERTSSSFCSVLRARSRRCEGKAEKKRSGEYLCERGQKLTAAGESAGAFALSRSSGEEVSPVLCATTSQNTDCFGAPERDGLMFELPTADDAVRT
jgi:hypothetical protein